MGSWDINDAEWKKFTFIKYLHRASEWERERRYRDSEPEKKCLKIKIYDIANKIIHFLINVNEISE